jgi:hypothetical protein
MRRLIIALLAACVTGAGAGAAVLAQSPSPSPDVVPLRVVMPDEGFAATFPGGWVVEVIGGESFVVSPDRVARCSTTGEWFNEPTDDPAAVLEKVAAIYPVFSDGDPLPVVETSWHELPAGRAVRFTMDYGLDALPGESDEGFGRYHTTYIIADSLRLIFFGCWSPERPDDDWLSIAETIELLPEEESTRASR